MVINFTLLLAFEKDLFKLFNLDSLDIESLDIDS